MSADPTQANSSGPTVSSGPAAVPAPPTTGWLSPFACRPEVSRGRLHAEPESETRNVFQRDRDRIIHSAAFRRLKYKTQVFVYHEGDYFRTRLTHSLEVAQIARSVSRSLGLCEDLAEAVSLAHDLGHTPFGHAGEDALDTAMQPFGGFDHNEQTLRILTDLEQRYAEFDGLNLTWECLEGVAKHNGPLIGDGTPRGNLPPYITAYNDRHDLEIETYPGLEAQVAALSDDIAYTNHDIDDGLRAGLFDIDAVLEVPLAGPVFAEVRVLYPAIDRRRLVHEATRRLITRMVDDLLAETRRRLAELRPASAQDVRLAGRPIVAFSEEMGHHVSALRAFLFRRMYRHFRVNRMTSKARRVVSDMFALLLNEPNCLPEEWQEIAAGPGSPTTARAVADYIAGMTDRYALEEHARLFDLYMKS